MHADCINNLVYLISCLLNDTQPDSERTVSLNLGELYTLAQSHSLLGITAFALEHAGIHDERFTAAKGQAIRKVILLSMDRDNVTRELDAAGIWHMTLKGSILKDYYPALGMRESGDCDILIDASRTEDIKHIMKRLGFTVEEFGEFHHDKYNKPPVSSFEMHKKLFNESQEEDLAAYYSDIKSRLIKDEGNASGYHFRTEDFYLYMTAHEYKHYSEGGTGLRSLVDVYVFLRKFGDMMDWEYISRELERAGLTDFEHDNRELALRLLNGQELTESQREMLRYILESGTYGNVEHTVINRMKHHHRSRVGYLWSRVFPPMNEIKDKYPFYYKHKVLIPFLIVRRLLRAFTKKHRMALGEIRTALKQ